MRVLAICGSLRAHSSNRAALEAAKLLAPPPMAMELFEGLAALQRGSALRHRRRLARTARPAARYWQSRHQQARVAIGGSAKEKRTAPHRQRPVTEVVMARSLLGRPHGRLTNTTQFASLPTG